MNDDAKLGIIGNAVAAGLEIEITYLGREMTAHPYLYGSDLFEQPFVFSYLPRYASYYKFFFDKITKVEPTSKAFRLTTQWQPIYFGQADEEIVAWNLGVVMHDGRFPRSLFHDETETEGTEIP